MCSMYRILRVMAFFINRDFCSIHRQLVVFLLNATSESFFRKIVVVSLHSPSSNQMLICFPEPHILDCGHQSVLC